MNSLPLGKLPAELLKDLLSRYVRPDPRVVVGPGVGEDAAIIDMGDRYLVAKTDPVTFATEEIGWYAVGRTRPLGAPGDESPAPDTERTEKFATCELNGLWEGRFPLIQSAAVECFDRRHVISSGLPMSQFCA